MVGFCCDIDYAELLLCLLDSLVSRATVVSRNLCACEGTDDGILYAARHDNPLILIGLVIDCKNHCIGLSC